jgi:hypothetical protein
MTQEDKMLLIKDLSARLPYAVTVEHTSGFRGTLHDITVHHMYDENDNIYDAICYTNFFGDNDSIYIEYFKPYLFPLSSMTEEQKKELSSFDPFKTDEVKTLGDWAIRLVEFYNKHHLDYHGLIPKGIAIDATGLNIY